ncbi:hypothetical protein ACFT7S_25150 [Streptomyces sp. NPDC057136]|uniref:hypothetical protein n=1 Tax=Streptomyces sp. NPDC057136 TaxID=3346029 RepID=UPI00363C203D
MTPPLRASALSGAGRSSRAVRGGRRGVLESGVHFYEEDTRLARVPPQYEVSVTEGDEPGAGYRVAFTAKTFLHDLALFPDRLDPAAGVDDMLVDLLPGESAVFHVTGAVLECPSALGSRPVLRCVNDTVAG